jgi:DNA-binding SARP family transcriptional activator
MPIIVRMLGHFSITYNQITLPQKNDRNKQMWMLLYTLLCNRNKPISQEQFIRILWPDDEVDNPAGALKNLVYRLRVTLKAFDRTDGKEYIIFEQGTYRWNNDIDVDVDYENLENLCEEAVRPDCPDERRIELLLKATSMYKGDFLQQFAYELWLVPMSTHLRTVYLNAVYMLCNLLFVYKRFDEAEAVAEKALTVDNLDEELHLIMVKSLVQQGKYEQAMSYYDYAVELMFREMDVSPSDEMRAAYEEMIGFVRDVKADLKTIQGELDEELNIETAYYCGYEVFKSIYRLQARRLDRSGESVYVGLLTLVKNNREEAMSKATCEKAMEQIKDASLKSLRKGDVVSRYSRTQFVLMLPSLTIENCDIVIQKIMRQFKAVNRDGTIMLQSTFLPMGVRL